MTSSLSLLVLNVPLALAAVALLAIADPGRRPTWVLLTSRLATFGALAASLVVAVAVMINGPLSSPTVGFAELGLSVRLDAVSATMFFVVSLVGALVVQFSRNYLDGDARHGAFLGGLCLTLAAVTVLVLAGNLFQLVLGWIATSMALHRLLVFYRDRPAAITAAYKKFLTARMSDLCLIAGSLVLYFTFGTGDVTAILESARGAAEGAVPHGVGYAALLIAFAALLKSAQFPAHGWLPEVMETPTPVSALLHAGIINAGGFLVIRFADLMLLFAPSMHVLAVVGGFTALFGGVVMLTQTSVKVSLAWSTVAQMGFMLLQCGLGAFALALLHIVAHSFYKAHAFLSSGSIVETARTRPAAKAVGAPSLRILFASFASALTLYFAIGWASGFADLGSAAVLTLGAVLVMGVSLLLSQSLAGEPSVYVMVRSSGAAALVTVLYFLLQAGASRLTASVLPEVPAPTAIDLGIMGLVVLGFGAVTVLQVLGLSQSTKPLWRAARVHIANGLYANAVFNRLTGALKRAAAGQS